MDCSVTKRKGCNYCLRSKSVIHQNNNFSLTIDDERNVLEINYNGLIVEFDGESHEINDSVTTCINYCPICGKEL
jgi:hypothetical protein